MKTHIKEGETKSDATKNLFAKKWDQWKQSGGLLYLLVRTFVRFTRFITRVWESIVFRVLLVLGLNVLAYFVIEALGENSYNRYTKFILIVNMAVLFVFLPGLHLTREAMRKHNISPIKQYVTTIFLVVFLLIMFALSVNFFMPYFFLSSKTNVGKTQRFVVLFLIVFFYSMLFMTYGDRMAALYDKIKNIPFLPSSTFVSALINLARFGVLYAVICLPIDLYRVLKNLVLGNYKVNRVLVGLVVLLLFLFVVLYHKQIADGTLRLNSDLVVLRKCDDEVYLNRQTNLGRYDDVIPWFTLNDAGKRKKTAVVSRSAIDPIEDYDGATPKSWDEYALDKWTGVTDKTGQIVSGELSVEEVWEQLKTHIKEDVYAPVRDWLVQPFEEDPQALAGKRKETQHLIVEGFREGAQGAQGSQGAKCPKYRYSDIKAELDAEDAAALEEKAYQKALVQFHSDDAPSGTKPHEVELINRKTNEYHPIAYSISLWVYLAPLTENYSSEKTILNFSNKLILCLSTDGSTMYVDIDAKWNKHDERLNDDPLYPKARQSGRVGKRVFALDTFAHQRWNHVVITTDHDGHMNAFINSVLVATNVHVRPDTSAKGSAHMIYLGEKNGARGKAKCVHYYNKTLTQLDVSLLYRRVPHLV